MRWPADGTVTSPFGQDGVRWHPGLDIGILRSLDVTAAADGVVTQVGFVRGYEGYGNVVLVRHATGYATLYAHLSRRCARRRARRAGERIGTRRLYGLVHGHAPPLRAPPRGNVPIDPSLLIVG